MKMLSMTSAASFHHRLRIAPDVTVPGMEYRILARHAQESGCDKRAVVAGTYVNGTFFYAVNYCQHEGDTCPRLNLPHGTGYELCQAQHAEANLAEGLAKLGMVSDGVLWVYGHFYACEPCVSAARRVGVHEVRVREELPPEKLDEFDQPEDFCCGGCIR